LYAGDVDIASIGNDGKFLSVNCKPFNGHSDTIPLSLGFANSGTYKMVLNNPAALGLDEHYAIYLVDILKQQVIDAKTTLAYTFTVDKNDPQTFGNKRFAVIIAELNTGVPEFTGESKESGAYLYPSRTQGLTTIYSKGILLENADIIVTDISGKTLTTLSRPQWINNQLPVDLTDYQSGLYFISILRNGQTLQTLKCIKE
jgi:hypothetical protein